MRFLWDDNKSRRNLAKHKVSFETALLVFDDPNAICRLDRITEGEERWQTLGLVGGMVILLVAHTYCELEGEEVIRIISARKATSHERKIYEQGG
jgi:uncharacterized protein